MKRYNRTKLSQHDRTEKFPPKMARGKWHTHDLYILSDEQRVQQPPGTNYRLYTLTELLTQHPDDLGTA